MTKTLTEDGNNEIFYGKSLTKKYKFGWWQYSHYIYL